MSVARNLLVAQSGGPTPVINSSLRGIIEAAASVQRHRHRLRGATWHRGRAQGGTARPLGPVGRGSGPAAIYPGGRLDRHLPLQAQAEPDRRLRSGDRGSRRPSDRLSALHRRQRLDGHGQQDRSIGPSPRARPGGGRRAQDDRQRRGRQPVPVDRPHAGLRLGGPLLDAQGPGRPTRRMPAPLRPIRCW